MKVLVKVGFHLDIAPNICRTDGQTKDNYEQMDRQKDNYEQMDRQKDNYEQMDRQEENDRCEK